MVPLYLIVGLLISQRIYAQQQFWNNDQPPIYQAAFRNFPVRQAAPQNFQIPPARIVSETFQTQESQNARPQFPQQQFYNQTRNLIHQNELSRKATIEPEFRRDLPPPPPAQFLPDKATLPIIRRPTIRRPHQIRRPFLVENSRSQRPIHRFMTTNITRVQAIPRTSVIPTINDPVTVVSTTTFPTPTPLSRVTKQHRFRNTTVNTSGRDPNKFFLDCCKHKKVDPKCESRCNFDALSKKVLTGMFIGSDVCPNTYGLALFSCAAQDSDHTTCCITKNVQKTSAKEKCLAFCNLSPDNRFQADASYLPCWGVLNKIKECFKEAIINGTV